LRRAPLPPHKGALVDGFVRAVRTGANTAADTRSLFDGISVALAADRSLQTGKLEEVHYL
jgi:hypothetical protein